MPQVRFDLPSVGGKQGVCFAVVQFADATAVGFVFVDNQKKNFDRRVFKRVLDAVEFCQPVADDFAESLFAFAVGDTVYFDKDQKRASKTDTNPVLGVVLTEKRPGTTVLEVALVPNVEK